MSKPLPRDGVEPLQSRIWLGQGSLYHYLGELKLPRATTQEIVRAIQERLQDHPHYAGAVFVQLPTEQAPVAQV